VSSGDTLLEDTWQVIVTVDDGDETATSNTAEVRVWPDEGDLVVTEFMADPDAAADKRGEWMELYNATSTDISLDDHQIEDLDYDCVDLTGLTIAADDYIVVCAEDDDAQNGGVTCDLEFTWGTGATTGCNQLALANTSDELVITNPAVDVDSIIWTTSWITTGAAAGLDPTAFDATSNDDEANWCDQETALSGGDAGTPGADNDGC
jgi:hypothetical protein